MSKRKTESYIFTDNGGKIYISGKVYFPTFLTFELSRDRAFDLAMQLLRLYDRSGASDWEGPIYINRPGVIEQDHDNELEWPEDDDAAPNGAG